MENNIANETVLNEMKKIQWIESEWIEWKF